MLFDISIKLLFNCYCRRLPSKYCFRRLVANKLPWTTSGDLHDQAYHKQYKEYVEQYFCD